MEPPFSLILDTPKFKAESLSGPLRCDVPAVAFIDHQSSTLLADIVQTAANHLRCIALPTLVLSGVRVRDAPILLTLGGDGSCVRHPLLIPDYPENPHSRVGLGKEACYHWPVGFQERDIVCSELAST